MDLKKLAEEQAREITTRYELKTCGGRSVGPEESVVILRDSLVALLKRVREEAVGDLESRVDKLTAIREGARLERNAEVKRVIEEVREKMGVMWREPECGDLRRGAVVGCGEILRRLGLDQGGKQ